MKKTIIEDGVQIRYRVNVTGRLRDPEGKYRDSLDQTLEVTQTNFDDPQQALDASACIEEEMRKRLFDALRDRGGVWYEPA